MFYDRRHVYCKCFHLLFLIRCFFIKSKIEKRKIQFLVTKRGQKPYPICFFEPQSPNFGWFHLLFLIHCHFVTPKLEKRKIPFLVTKRNQKLKMINFSDEQFPECAQLYFLIQKTFSLKRDIIVGYSFSHNQT